MLARTLWQVRGRPLSSHYRIAPSLLETRPLSPKMLAESLPAHRPSSLGRTSSGSSRSARRTNFFVPVSPRSHGSAASDAACDGADSAAQDGTAAAGGLRRHVSMHSPRASTESMGGAETPPTMRRRVGTVAAAGSGACDPMNHEALVMQAVNVGGLKTDLGGPVKQDLRGRKGSVRQAQTGADDLLGQLGSLRWFENLSHSELRTLLSRAEHLRISRYRTIIREGAMGFRFYLLIKGKVRVVAAEGGICFELPNAAGRRYFGEASLVTAVKREASVVALEDCYLIAFGRNDMDGLPVDLGTVRAVMCARMLRKVAFFKTLPQSMCDQVTRPSIAPAHSHSPSPRPARPPTQTLLTYRPFKPLFKRVACRRALCAQLGKILDVGYYPAGTVIFREGEKSDRFFILVEGLVHVVRTAADGSEQVRTPHAARLLRLHPTPQHPPRAQPTHTYVHTHAPRHHLTRRLHPTSIDGASILCSSASTLLRASLMRAGPCARTAASSIWELCLGSPLNLGALPRVATAVARYYRDRC